MIIFVYGPTLKPAQYRKLERDILQHFVKKTVDARGFDKRDVRIFFPRLAHKPQSVEVALFGGSGIATTIREEQVWRRSIEESVAPHFPRCVINGFVTKLDATSQFCSVYPYADRAKHI